MEEELDPSTQALVDFQQEGSGVVVESLVTQFANEIGKSLQLPGKVIGVRLPDAICLKIYTRAKKNHMTISAYCRSILEREVNRSHHKNPSK